MSKKRLILLFVFLVIMVIFFIPYFGIKNQFINFFASVGRPFSGISSGFKGFFSDIGSVNDLSKSNNELIQKNNELNSQIASYKELEIENTKLKEELGFVKSSSQKIVGAQVISKSIVPYLKDIIIDKGKNNSVQKGQVVLSQGHLAGVISEVFDDYAKVELLTSSNVLIPVILQKSRSTGILRSQLDGFFIQNIPIDDKVEVGENVLTNNLSENIPQDILIGTVSSIETYKSQIFQTVKVHSPLEFSKIDFVFIVINNTP